jgi:hypothetical protein
VRAAGALLVVEECPKCKAPDWKIFFAQLTTSHEKIKPTASRGIRDRVDQAYQIQNHPESRKLTVKNYRESG